MNTENISKEKALLPGCKMRLIDGSIIDICPRQNILDGIDNALRLDTTGQYLAIGSKIDRRPTHTEEALAQDRHFFLDNVFFFVAHSEEILADSRMFLAPVAVRNGLAYTGTSGFRRPTLGVYLEWWTHHGHTVVTDKDGKLQFYWFISGSPLSGRNSCAVVDEHGARLQRPVCGFPNYWRTFKNVNTRYDECKTLGEAYTLQQVKQILSQNDNGHHIEKAYNYLYRWRANAEISK